jgi:hypothetical protein
MIWMCSLVSNSTRRLERKVELMVRVEGSKVGVGKTIFESPEKAREARSGVVGWNDPPKQRKP